MEQPKLLTEVTEPFSGINPAYRLKYVIEGGALDIQDMQLEIRLDRCLPLDLLLMIT
jgi:hypothetical protein